MNLYVMRHGTTVWNEKGITQGRTNNRLSKGGVLLTQEVAEKLRNSEKYKIILFTSLFLFGICSLMKSKKNNSQ